MLKKKINNFFFFFFFKINHVPGGVGEAQSHPPFKWNSNAAHHQE